MDSVSHKVYKSLEIRKWSARLIYKDEFKNPERGFTLPLLFICKLDIFIFLS